MISITDGYRLGATMILITGGLGHIGSATVQALLDVGEGCVLVQRRSPDIPDGRFSAPVSAVQADVEDLDALRAIGRDHPITESFTWPARCPGHPIQTRRRCRRRVRRSADSSTSSRLRRSGESSASAWPVRSASTPAWRTPAP